jgi:hypothetical protein
LSEIKLLDSAWGKTIGTISRRSAEAVSRNRTGKVAPEHKRLSRVVYRAPAAASRGTMKLDEICALPVADIAA